jgi:hypothetical protein
VTRIRPAAAGRESADVSSLLQLAGNVADRVKARNIVGIAAMRSLQIFVRPEAVEMTVPSFSPLNQKRRAHQPQESRGATPDTKDRHTCWRSESADDADPDWRGRNVSLWPLVLM